MPLFGDEKLSDYTIAHKLPITMFTYPQGIESVEDLQKVSSLLDNNFNVKDEREILFENFERVYKNILTD
jgi:microsomal dipeptidase-like Zn-dependent dipeptidase